MADVTLMSLLSVLGHPVPIQNPYPASLQCNGPLPLYLREPHSLPRQHHQDYGTRSLANQTFPLIDNNVFFKTWTERFSKNRQSSQTTNSDLHEPPSHPREKNAYKRSWKYVPIDISGLVNEKTIALSFHGGDLMFNNTLNLEKKLEEKNLSLDKNSASYFHQALFRRTHHLAQLFSTLGFIMDYSTIILLDEILNRPGLAHIVTPLELQLLGPVEVCEGRKPRPEVGPCDISMRYRTINGTCNNILNPTWGSAFSRLRRLVPPDYGDGVMSLRRAQDNTSLPSARLVSSTINSLQKSSPTPFSFLFLTFGQFVDHDMTNTPVVKGANDSTIPCCSEEVINNTDLIHPECAPISIPFDDPFYSTWAATCMEFVRSVPAGRCQLGPREQVNQITGFLDGSNIYGSTEEECEKLREGKGGRLLMLVNKNGENFLQPSIDPDDGCNDEEYSKKGEFCFISGDDRVNEQVMLTLMHTIWTREHNRIARQLEALNPTLPDDVLFQEARRTVVAEMQHIVYNEFLPAVLGKSLMELLNLSPRKDGRKTKLYNPDIDPGISNEFATAAFRFGHSMLPDNVQEKDKNGKTKATELNSVLFRPFSLYTDGTPERLVRGSRFQNSLKVDNLFTEEISGKLFRGDIQFGLDLVALNVQRGRDHGIGSYLTLREACGLPRVTTFSELKLYLIPGALQRLKMVYRTVEDIDLFAGGVSEKAIDGGLVGPTFACIIADQFLRLKTGDRFWYEEDRPGGFTRDQLRELRSVSMARIVCNNVRNMHTISRWPMQVPSAFNPQIPCDSTCIPSINFNFWKDDLLHAEEG